MSSQPVNLVRGALHDIATEYSTLSTNLANWVASQPDNVVSIAYHFIGRQVRYLRNEVIPAIDGQIPEFISTLARNSFWVVPVLAFSLGDYGAFSTSIATWTISLLHPDYKLRELAEHVATLEYVKAGLGICVGVLSCAMTMNSVFVAGILFNSIRLVKLTLVLQDKDGKSS